ncbi:MAG: hypothetical protein ACAI38_13810 [Myxococcota bacterium]|nr:hypothetical protein [Myxococcota bacterium]
MRTRLLLALVSLFLASPAASQDMEDAPRNLEFVGFQQFREVSRVFVRTNEPARYRVSQRDGVVSITLDNTGSQTMNNLRHLDTHLFDGPVAMIQPRVIEGASNSNIQIDIYVRQTVNVKQAQKDNVITLDFPRN